MNPAKGLNLILFSDEEEDKKILWDEYVLTHPEGRFCHLMGYKKVVERTYGYKAIYFAIEKDNRIVGIFPSFLCKSIFFGKKILSQPFSEYGGILAHELTQSDYEKVFEALGETMSETKVNLIEIHGGFGIPENIKEKCLSPIFSHHCALLRLDDKVDEIWKKRISYEARKAVRKAERNGVICYEKVDADMITNKFYPLFLACMKRLGVPPHPVAYYVECYEHLKDYLKIFWAEYEGKIIAALLGFAVGKGIHIINTVSDEKHWEKRPNDLCHWNFIKWGGENRYEYFDLGSVRYEGQRRYKEKWGAKLKEYAHYLLITDSGKRKVKFKTFDSSSKSMGFLSSVWHKFVPLKVSKFLGPKVRKQLAR
jgi:lipid II:glycine glycyltransferase (peptidoglycan interpeptide bridge formation enzyme)